MCVSAVSEAYDSQKLLLAVVPAPVGRRRGDLKTGPAKEDD